MRRADREVTGFDNLVAIMERCDVCRVGFLDGEVPYILPLNFGMQAKDGRVTLFFHGAGEGKKYALMDKNPQVAFQMDCAHKLVTDRGAGYCTMAYESVMGRGILSRVPDAEKEEALRILMAHYHPGEDVPFDHAALPRTVALRLDVTEMTGKRRQK